MLQTQDMGKVVWALMGDYDATENYEKLDVVDFTDANGVELTYYCLADNLNQPVTNTTYWKLLSARGPAGDAGADSVVPGPPGEDSVVPGPPGNSVQGEPGEQGVEGNSRYSTQAENVAGTATDVGPSVAGVKEIINDQVPRLAAGTNSRVERLPQVGAYAIELIGFSQGFNQSGVVRLVAKYNSHTGNSNFLKVKLNGTVLYTLPSTNNTTKNLSYDITVAVKDIITITVQGTSSTVMNVWDVQLQTSGANIIPYYVNTSNTYYYDLPTGG